MAERPASFPGHLYECRWYFVAASDPYHGTVLTNSQMNHSATGSHMLSRQILPFRQSANKIFLFQAINFQEKFFASQKHNPLFSPTAHHTHPTGYDHAAFFLQMPLINCCAAESLYYIPSGFADIWHPAGKAMHL